MKYFLAPRSGEKSYKNFKSTIKNGIPFEIVSEYLNKEGKEKVGREESGLGQIEVAKKLDKTQSYISKIESGQRRFDVLQLKEFAKIYKKNVDYFIE